MLTLASLILTALAVLLCLPVAVFAVEVLAAVIFKHELLEPETRDGQRPRLAVLVPAHNESQGILPTLSDVTAQLQKGDRLLVVADNCSDDTAKVAAAAGAQVVERHDAERLGKGYALDWGLRHLQADPPPVLIVVDADCRLSQGALASLARSCTATGRPAQALYLMQPPGSDRASGQGIAHFAWIVKNQVRPLGLAALGGPCQLMGTGMAFPWRAIGSITLASGNLVEDLKLGLDLAAKGFAPHFCHWARVDSTFPATEQGALTQRRRWETGSLRTLLADAPLFLGKALMHGNPPLLVLALDALVPPLVLLVAALVTVLVLASLFAFAGGSALPVLLAAGALIVLAASIALAWGAYGRGVLRAGDLRRLVAYLLMKLRIYRPAGRRGSQWIRTDRR